MIIDESGRPDLEEVEMIKGRLIQIIEEVKVSHPERIRRIYNQKFRNGTSRKIAWITIRKYLDQLKVEGKIREEIITKGKRRTISFIRANY